MKNFGEEGKDVRMGKDWAAPLVMEVSHIRCTVNLLQDDAIQQLAGALLCTLASQVIEVLAGGLTSPSSPIGSTQPHPKVLTSTSPAPPPTSVLVFGAFYY